MCYIFLIWFLILFSRNRLGELPFCPTWTTFEWISLLPNWSMEIKWDSCLTKTWECLRLVLWRINLHYHEDFVLFSTFLRYSTTSSEVCWLSSALHRPKNSKKTRIKKSKTFRKLKYLCSDSAIFWLYTLSTIEISDDQHASSLSTQQFGFYSDIHI